jgi:hypothetical protein
MNRAVMKRYCAQAGVRGNMVLIAPLDVGRSRDVPF